MTTYLNKEAVLNALDEEAQVGEKCTILRLRSRLEHGEFDAPQIPMGIDHLGLAKALADKDAEITRLNEKNAIRKPAQKELELFICPEAGCMSLCRFCRHNTPHECDGLQDYRPCKGNCIPVKPPTPQPSPVPTSGTGTAPEHRKRDKGSPEGWCSESCGFFGACDAADVRACKKDAHRNAHDAAIRKDERERALKLAADIWGIAACVEKKNTDEFMEYFRKCMKEFEERYNSLKSPEQEQKP